MKGRTEVINYLIKKYNYVNYLEIGSAYKHNFDMVECEKKTGVDPAYPADYHMTSDEFFRTIENIKYDLIFIDGLHRSEQVVKDFLNSVKHLNQGGIILLHDCLPSQEEHQLRSRCKLVGDWTGDVWKAVVALKYKGYCFETIDCDWGISVWEYDNYNGFIYSPADLEASYFKEKFTYEYFKENKKKLMNIISLEDFYRKHKRRTK